MPEPTVPSTREETQSRETTRAQEQYIQPPVDIFEEGHDLTVVADMPGVGTEDLDVRVEQGILTLQAKAKSSLPGEPYYREFQLVNFFRQFELPDVVDVSKISAELKIGVLTLRLPNSEAAKPRRIQVNTQ
ncbi:MAG: Hsp20/alpha crystallin family protein [Chloroflexota bacterium]